MSFETQMPGVDAEAAAPHGLIRRYEEIADASRSMLEAAHRGDWAGVEVIEQRCRDLIAGLKLAARSNRLGDGEKQRRMSLLRAILEDDAQIRRRAEPWLRDLEDFLAVAEDPARRGP